MQMRVTERVLRLRTPLQSAYGTVRERELLTVALTDAEGLTGYGEAAPLEPYDGVSVARVRAALEAYRPVLMQSERANGMQLIEACRRLDDLPAALAAIDLALWDRAGRRAGRPVAALLTDDPAAAVAVNATLGATDRAGAAEQAARAAQLGFGCVKVKVGVGDDAGRVAAVRAAVGPARRAARGRQRRLGRRGSGARDRCARPGGPRARGGAHPRPGGGARGARARGGARGDRRDRGRARRARRGRRRRGLPEDLPLRGHRRPARRRRACQSLRRGGLPRLHARRARSESPPRSTPPPRSPRADRCPLAASPRSACSRTSTTRSPPAKDASRCPARRGWGWRQLD